MKYEITGASYIGRPLPHTAMYISRKVEQLLVNLDAVEECLVFAENGIEVPETLAAKHDFQFTDNPQRDYAKFVMRLAAEREKTERQRKYTLMEGGWYCGENVSLGEGAYIEPGVLIGHDVIIGRNATLLAGCVIKRAVIGDEFYCNEGAAVGTNGFTMAEDDDGHKLRIPTLGGVRIGNHVEVGAQDNISCGSAGDTVLADNVKLDALVHIGHDDQIGMDTEIAAGCVLGGFDSLGERIFMGINSAVRNRVEIGADVFVGMSSAVVRRVHSGRKIAGNPARRLP